MHGFRIGHDTRLGCLPSDPSIYLPAEFTVRPGGGRRQKQKLRTRDGFIGTGIPFGVMTQGLPYHAATESELAAVSFFLVVVVIRDDVRCPQSCVSPILDLPWVDP